MNKVVNTQKNIYKYVDIVTSNYIGNEMKLNFCHFVQYIQKLIFITVTNFLKSFL